MEFTDFRKEKEFMGFEKKELEKDKKGFMKFDGEKIRMDLIPPELLIEVGKLLTHGAKKYSDRNWEKGTKWGRYYGALQRHLWAWWAGEDLDPETKESHLSHAACCLSFLMTYEKRKIGEDDRKLKKEWENS